MQAIIHNKYSMQSDVWSFGCVLYEIWSLGHAPFEDIDGREVRSCLLQSQLVEDLPVPYYMYIETVCREAYNWIQTPATSWLS